MARATRGTLIRKTARHETASTRMPPTNGPRMVVAPEPAAHTPNARPCSSPSKVDVISASEPGTSSAPAAPWRTRKTMSVMMSGATPHSRLITPNAASPIANILRLPK